MDQLAFIMAVEEDPSQLSIEEYVEGMAGMIRTNIAFNLQGSWGRAAMHLIEGGIIDRDGNINQDALDAVMA
jgi:hypothetical protein